MLIDIVTIALDGRGGLENVITSVYKGLTARGHKIRVFLNQVPYYKEWLDTIGEVYYYETRYGDHLLGLYREYSECLKKHGMPDAILATHSPSQSFICKTAVTILNQLEPAVISWVHTDIYFFGNCWAFSCSDAHMAVSSTLGRQIKNEVRDKSEVYVIGNPVEIVSNEDIIQEHNTLKFMYVGRITIAQKRLDLVFYALFLLNVPWSLDIFGVGCDEETLKQLAVTLNISEHITWHGWCEHPFQYMDTATALIAPGEKEGFGLVMAESLMRGIPVIACKSPGSEDIVKEGVNGWLYDPNDVDGLAAIMRKIHSGQYGFPDPESCKESVQRFDQYRVYERMEKIIKQTVEKKRRCNEEFRSNSSTELL